MPTRSLPPAAFLSPPRHVPLRVGPVYRRSVMPNRSQKGEPSARDRILRTSSEMFYREGFRAVGVDRIVAASGVAKMTLYKHFPSKDDLIVAVLEKRHKTFTAWLTAQVSQRIDGGSPPIDAFFGVLKEWASLPDFRGCPFLNACAEFADASHPGRSVTAAYKNRLVEILASIAAQCGSTRPEESANQLLLLVNGAVICAAMMNSLEPLDWAQTAARRLII